MKITTKKWIYGCIVGVFAGALIGGYTVAVIAGTAFINYSLNQDKVCDAMNNLTKLK
jgi:hypothetical protein